MVIEECIFLANYRYVRMYNNYFYDKVPHQNNLFNEIKPVDCYENWEKGKESERIEKEEKDKEKEKD